MSPACLSVDGVTVLFGGVCALDDISYEFAASGVVAIVGPNGAGKSTLLNVIAGTVVPARGSVRFGDLETTRASPDQVARARIRRTFQEVRLISPMPAIDSVLLARVGQRGERLWRAAFRAGYQAEEQMNRTKAMAILSRVGLAHQALEAAGNLSYGQQKLLSLATCLAGEPSVLLLDEPIAGIHPELRQTMLVLLREIASEGKIVVFVEHDVAAVQQIADTVIVLDHGRMVASGPPNAVLALPNVLEAFIT